MFNELFLLMCIPSLDGFFRNQTTGKLKGMIGFIVDNGPSEAPSNFLVQMLIARLVKFLDLNKATQSSFAEYLSKRNFMERVHTVENKVLSDHGPFSSKQVHEPGSPGGKEHKENMERMAQDIVECIGKGVFNKEQIRCFRGIGSEENYIFGDEEELKNFSLLSEERKQKDKTYYHAIQSEKLSYLEKVWGVKANFAGTYGGDYNTLESTKTAFLDKYNTTIFRNHECWLGHNPLERFNRQPLPDYKLWEEVKELHYIAYEEPRDFPEGPWHKSQGLFLPEKILDMCFRVLPTPSTKTLVSIAFLAWVSIEEASNYFTTTYKKLKQQKEEDMQRETWREHSLYSESRETLPKMCSDSGLFAVGKKHELVR